MEKEILYKYEAPQKEAHENPEYLGEYYERKGLLDNEESKDALYYPCSPDFGAKPRFRLPSDSIEISESTHKGEGDEELWSDSSSESLNPETNTFYLYFLSYFAAIGGFLFGYDTSVVAGVNLYIEKDFPLITNFEKEAIVSMTLLGAAIGSLVGGPIADKYGRKPTIFISDLLFAGGCIAMTVTPTISFLIFGRFIVGLGVGVSAMVITVYLGEISPKHLRGEIGNINVLTISIGQLLALVICLLLTDKWRWMLGLAAIPAILQAIGILFLCESPRWLYKNHQNDKALEALKLIYREHDYKLSIIIDEQKREELRIRQFENYGYLKSLQQLLTKYRPCLIAGWGIQMFQQLIGINTAMYYGPEIMKMAGFGDQTNKRYSLISSIPLTLINMIGTLIALFTIDKYGRRFLILRNLPFISISMGLIGLGMALRNYTEPENIVARDLGKWLAALSLGFYILFFSIGMGPQPWVINSEIYPLHLRGLGNSLGTTVNWVANFGVSMLFLTLLDDVKYGNVFVFEIILFFSIWAWIFTYYFIPETKNLTLDQVLEQFIPDSEVENAKKD